MSGFAWALALFVLSHIGISGTPARAASIGVIGERAYRIVFTLVSIALLGWLIYAFGQMRRDPFDPINAVLWQPAPWLRHVAYLLVLIGFVFAASGFTVRNPTRIGGEASLNQSDGARGIVRITRHPFMWGLVFWAAGHLLVNGERFALMLFGALGLMAIVGARALDRRKAHAGLEGWDAFEEATSNVPFLAIVQKRNRFALKEMWLGIGAGVLAFALFGFFHGAIVGKPAF